MRMTLFLSVLSLVAAALLTPASAADKKAQSFVDKATVGGMFEIESSQLALKMSKDSDLKKFADMMISDHGKANAELASVAKKEGLKVPAELDHKAAALIKELQNAGVQFDTLYIKAQLDGHQETVKMFQEYADNGDNKALQTFAVKTLPTLRMHLDSIEKLSGRVSATK
jgi:putative membrane protein